MNKYTIKSFFELTSEQTGQNRALNLRWLLKAMGKPGACRVDESLCVQFATNHGWGGDRSEDVPSSIRLTFPITMWEALEVAFEVWPEAFDVEVSSPVGQLSNLGEYLNTYLEKHGLEHKMSLWVAGESSPTVAVRVISELRLQLDEKKKTSADVEDLERYLAKNFKADLEDSNERVPIVAIKVLARLNQSKAHAEANSRALANLGVLDHFVRDNFPSEYEGLHELGTSLMVQNIMVREMGRQSDAFPMWERSWEQMNRIAEFICSHKGEESEQLYDDSRVVIPEKVADVVRLYIQHIFAGSKNCDMPRQRVDRTSKVRAQVIEKLVTEFMTADIRADVHTHGDNYEEQLLNTIHTWDQVLHEPPWLGYNGQYWHIDDQGCLIVGEVEDTEIEDQE